MNYQAVIVESSDDLRQVERETKDLKARDRVRFVRLLKSGAATTQQAAGALIGLQVRQSQRLWRQYRTGGLAAIRESRYQGGVAKLDAAQEARFSERLKADDISSLEQARACLQSEFGVSYTIGGVSVLFGRLKVKLKTGRPQNIRQSAVEREEFAKKNIRS